MTTTHQDLAARIRARAEVHRTMPIPSACDKITALELAEVAAALEAASQPPGAVIHQHGFAADNQRLRIINESMDKQLEEVMRERDERDDVLADIAHLIDREFTSAYGFADLVSDLGAALSAPSPAQAPVVQGEAKRREPMTTAERAALRESLLLGDGMGFHSTVTGVEAFHGIGVNGADQ